MNATEKIKVNAEAQKLVLDKDLKILDYKGTFLSDRGYFQEFKKGDYFYNILPKFWSKKFTLICRRVLNEGKTFKKVISPNSHSKHSITFLITIEPLVNNGKITGVVFAGRNFTENSRLALQHELHEKMSIMSVLAAQIADRLNNPLASVLNRIGTLLADGFVSIDFLNLKGELQSMQDQLYSMSLITNAMQSFSQEPQGNFVKLQLNDIIAKSIELSKMLQLQHNINYWIVLDEKLPSILGSEITLEQAFVNIIRNGLEAMPNGGVLKISSAIDKVSSKYLKIVIRDNGIGIDNNVVKRIYDPFFTTKSDGHPGLGLSISYGIIANHHGSIEINSKVNKGTKVTVLLPRADV
ncbi:MAG: hypothetical protein GWP06_06860 [Actinobacteria bacterium]|nr:hypothetical protein [Actinomycetota bacterium]